MIGSNTSIKGFTLVEVILMLGVFVIIFSSSRAVFGSMISRNSLRYHGYQLVQNLREARSFSIAQKGDSEWGIYFDDVSTPNAYVFFKGDTYSNRDPLFDLVFEFPDILNISQLNLGGSSELVFDRKIGSTSDDGSVELSIDDSSFDIDVNELGFASYSL